MAENVSEWMRGFHSGASSAFKSAAVEARERVKALQQIGVEAKHLRCLTEFSQWLELQQRCSDENSFK